MVCTDHQLPSLSLNGQLHLRRFAAPVWSQRSGRAHGANGSDEALVREHKVVFRDAFGVAGGGVGLIARGHGCGERRTQIGRNGREGRCKVGVLARVGCNVEHTAGGGFWAPRVGVFDRGLRCVRVDRRRPPTLAALAALHQLVRPHDDGVRAEHHGVAPARGVAGQDRPCVECVRRGQTGSSRRMIHRIHPSQVRKGGVPVANMDQVADGRPARGLRDHPPRGPCRHSGATLKVGELHPPQRVVVAPKGVVLPPAVVG
mmetsp:Transcript_18689/g.48700  ORF Transcript_18689/g.48700 Transcript_18689/m.48700 type:complete len:259 (-) Transcript_18689:764-1540(-)